MNQTPPKPPSRGDRPSRSYASRVDTAYFALASSLWARGENPREVDEDAVTDLLADLRHLCRALKLDYARCDRLAETHFEEETEAGS